MPFNLGRPQFEIFLSDAICEGSIKQLDCLSKKPKGICRIG
jgi:hypothetical protein